MKVAHLAIAKRIKANKATAEDFDKLDADPKGYDEILKHMNEEDEAEAAREDGEARAGQAAAFDILMSLIQQLDDQAAAQVDTARAQAESAQAQAVAAKALVDAAKTLTGGLKELADKLAQPKTRTGTVELPDGRPVKMTITERRQ